MPELVVDEKFNGKSVIPEDRGFSGDDAVSFLVLKHGKGDKHGFAPYYTSKLDQQLRKLSKELDYLKIGIYNVVSRMMSLEPSILSETSDLTDPQNQSLDLQRKILLQDWYSEMPKFLNDLIICNNGAFLELKGLEVVDAREPLEPINIGNGIILPSLGFRHLDSGRCFRTGNAEFPVRYRHTNGEQYIFHRSRVVMLSDMPSPEEELHNVGMSAVYRTLINANQILHVESLITDMVEDGFINQIIFAYPFDQSQIRQALELAEERGNEIDSDDKNKRVVVVGSQHEAAQIEQVELQRLPEGYDKETAVRIFMALFASAVSFDIREIWPISGQAGATKADAEIQHIKMQRKFVLWFVKNMTMILDNCYVSMFGRIDFGYIDEVEAREGQEKRKFFGETIGIELANQTINVETAIKQYVEAGFYSQQEGEEIIAALQIRRMIDQANLIPTGTRQIGFGDTEITAELLDEIANNANGQTKAIIDPESPVVDQTEQYEISQANTEDNLGAVDAIVTLYILGRLSNDELQEQMEKAILDEHLTQGMIAIQSKDLDLTTEGLVLGTYFTQRAFLNRLMGEIDSINEGSLRARLKMYIRSGTRLFAEAKNMFLGIPPKPFYPAERTICLSNCGCGWDDFIDEDGQWIESIYFLGKDDNCPTCLAREKFAGSSNPWKPERIGETLPSDVFR